MSAYDYGRFIKSKESTQEPIDTFSYYVLIVMFNSF